MDIKLSDHRGNTYRLIPKSQSASVNKSGAPKIHTLKDAIDFLNSLDATAPAFWRTLWKQIDPSSVPSGDQQIIKKIAQQLKDKHWLISRDKAASSSASTKSKFSSGKTRGRYSGGGGGGSGGSNINVDNSGIGSANQPVALGPAMVDRPFTRNFSPAKPVPDEDNAITSATPSKVNEDSDTGVVVNEDETTKGCPISMVSGEEVLPLTDFTLPGPVPFVWTRFYRTGHNRDIGLGHGWTHAACETLHLEKNQVVLFDKEGRQLRFARPALYQRSKLINEGLNLDFEGKDCFVLKQTDQPDKMFSRLGDGSHFRLTQIRHADYRPVRHYSWGETEPAKGFCIDLHYNAGNQLTRIQGNWGKGLKLSRNAQGRISCVEQTRESRTLNKSPAEKSTVKKIVAEYEYSEAGDLIAQRNAAGKGERYQYTHHVITQRTLVTGFSYYYEWDQLNTHGRCLRNWGDKGIYNYHFKWDPQNNTSTATDSRGYTTTYIYNEFGEIVEECDPEGGNSPL